jgi:hypothetical protein
MKKNQRKNQQNYGRIELVNDPETIAEDVENGLPLLFETIFSSQVITVELEENSGYRHKHVYL